MKLLELLARIFIPIAINKIKLNEGNVGGCKNLVPGLERMAVGVDVTQLELKHDYDVDHLDGFRSRILTFTCKNGQTWTSPFDGQEYAVPDQVDLVQSLPSGIGYSETKLDTNMEQVRETMSAEAGVESVLPGLFSASLTYKESHYKLANTSRFVVNSKAYVSTTQIDYIPSRALNHSLSQYTVELIQALPDKYEDDPNLYLEFIDTYGTHFYSSGYFGGTLLTSFKIDKDYLASTSESEVKVNLEATFYSFLKAHGAYSGDVAQASAAFQSASTNSQRYFGGMDNVFEKEGYSKWWPTVARNPWLCGGKLRPLSDLVAEGPKKQALIKATHVYIMKAYLQESKRTGLSFLGKAYKGERTVAEFLSQADVLLTQTSPQDGVVVALGQNMTDYVMTPAWFSKAMTICVDWKKSLHGPEMHYECSDVLKKSSDYSVCDGCAYTYFFFFQKVPGVADEWWINVIAKRWGNEFMVEVPEQTAPGWALNMQMCFYSDHVPHCARANSYTREFNYHRGMTGAFNFLTIN